MQLEMHQLELRYERLRRRNPKRERQLLISIGEYGQQQPIIVVGDAQRWLLIDGYKRVRVMRRLRQETVLASEWRVDESAALMLDQLMRSRDAQDPLQQGWLLQELLERFQMDQKEMARRFDKSRSWISRRLGLVKQLPVEIQDEVRAGRLVPHAVMKYLVPLARANPSAARILSAAIAPLRLSSRQVGVLYAGWTSGADKTQELILNDPQMYLRAHEQAMADTQAKTSAGNRLVADLNAIAEAARRCRRRLSQGLWQQMPAADRCAAKQANERARSETEALFGRMDKEDDDARPRDTSRDSATA
jgi:ParB family transcriptional regulator, chromosome partitioning protein